ncbi:MAG: hypothetical protein SNH27_07490 [Rikenellaceae bacterium]
MNSIKFQVSVGDRVYFAGEERPYRVRECNENFAICTKPFNLQRTVFYSIIDFKRNVRGQDNLVLGHGYETNEDCEDAMRMLANGYMEVSSRNSKFEELEIIKIKKNRKL